jgi:uncharacterized protein YgiM (DUF1202 family)
MAGIIRRLLTPFLALFLLIAGGCEKKEKAETPPVASGPEEPQPYLTTQDVRVRNGPGTQYKIVAEIKRGTKVSVAGTEGSWLKVVSKHGNPPGYIDARFARPAGEPVRQEASPSPGAYRVTAETFVREGPGLHFKTVAKLEKGTKINVVGSDGDWLKVQSKHGNPPGYIEKRYAERGAG